MQNFSIYALFIKNMSSQDDEDFELKRIRMRKLQRIMEQKKKQEEKKNKKTLSVAEKIDRLLKVILSPQAQQYLEEIKQKNMELYNKIRSQLFPPQISSKIDILLMYLQRGMIRSGIINKRDLQHLERKILGVKSKITIKKRGEESLSLDSFLKDKD